MTCGYVHNNMGTTHIKQFKEIGWNMRAGNWNTYLSTFIAFVHNKTLVEILRSVRSHRDLDNNWQSELGNLRRTRCAGSRSWSFGKERSRTAGCGTWLMNDIPCERYLAGRGAARARGGGLYNAPDRYRGRARGASVGRDHNCFSFLSANVHRRALFVLSRISYSHRSWMTRFVSCNVTKESQVYSVNGKCAARVQFKLRCYIYVIFLLTA